MSANGSHRRFLWGGLGAVVVLALGSVALAWTWGWFAPPTEIPGDSNEGDRAVVAVVQEARAAVAREPKSAAAWGRLGQVLQIHNILDPALVAYAEAIRLEPRNSDWPYLRASILLVRAGPADAIPDLERAAELGGLDELPRLRLGELLLGQGRFEEASEQVRRVLESRPNDPRAHLQMAQVEVSRQAWAECLRQLDAVGDAPPARKQVCALRSMAYTRLGDAAGARREQDRLARLPDDPRWPDPLLDELTRFQVGVRFRVTRALTMFQQGQTHQAISMLQDAVHDYPDSEIVHATLGRCLALAGDLGGAEEALKKCLDLAPESAEIWATLAVVRLRRQNPKGALDCLLRVNDLKPADSEAHYKVGLIRAETGDRAGAVEAFRQALRYRSDYREAREELDKLTGGSPKR